MIFHLLSEPTMIDDCDYLVMESTYGSRLHIRNDQKAELFLNIVSETTGQWRNSSNTIICSRKNTRNFI